MVQDDSDSVVEDHHLLVVVEVRDRLVCQLGLYQQDLALVSFVGLSVLVELLVSAESNLVLERELVGHGSRQGQESAAHFVKHLDSVDVSSSIDVLLDRLFAGHVHIENKPLVDDIKSFGLVLLVQVVRPCSCYLKDL